MAGCEKGLGFQASVRGSVHSLHCAGSAALHVRQKRKPGLSILMCELNSEMTQGRIISSKCCGIACLLLFVFYQIRFLYEVFYLYIYFIE